MLFARDFKNTLLTSRDKGFADSLEFFPLQPDALGIGLAYLAVQVVTLGDGLQQVGELSYQALGMGEEAFG